MLQSMIERNSEIYHLVSKLEMMYTNENEKEFAVKVLEELSSISWGIDAPRKSYHVLAAIDGGLTAYYFGIELDNALNPCKLYDQQLALLAKIIRLVEKQLYHYRKYIALEGRDRI